MIRQEREKAADEEARRIKENMHSEWNGLEREFSRSKVGVYSEESPTLLRGKSQFPPRKLLGVQKCKYMQFVNMYANKNFLLSDNLSTKSAIYNRKHYFCCESHSLGVMPVMALKVR